MARLVRHVRAEVAAHDAMPRRVVLLVKLLLDKRSNVLEKTKPSVSPMSNMCQLSHVGTVLHSETIALQNNAMRQSNKATLKPFPFFACEHELCKCEKLLHMQSSLQTFEGRIIKVSQGCNLK